MPRDAGPYILDSTALLIGNSISQREDPCEPTSIMECHKGLTYHFRCQLQVFSLDRRSVPSFVSWEHKLSIAERWQTSRKVFWRLVEVHETDSVDIDDLLVQATGGEGVDVVLNSLSGKAIPASLNLCLSIIKVIKPHISIDIFDIWLLGWKCLALPLPRLRDFGRFVEIGKRDQYEGTQMELTPFLKGFREGWH